MCTPTDQSSTEDKDRFYLELEGVMANTNRLTIVMGDFNASISNSVQGVVGSLGLSTEQMIMVRDWCSLLALMGLHHKHFVSPQTYPPDDMIFTRPKSLSKSQRLCISETTTTTISARHMCV